MNSAQSACSINIELLKIILDWLGQQSTVIVAVVGFVAAIIVAKITSGLELNKALCLKRAEAYESARCQLMRMTNVYEIILGQMAAISQDTDSKSIDAKIALLVTQFTKLGTVMEQDEKLARIALYSTELPRQDARQLLGEEPRFVNVITGILTKLQCGSSEEEREALEGNLKQAINRFAPLMQNELQHLYTIDEKLKNDMQKDKRLRKLFQNA